MIEKLVTGITRLIKWGWSIETAILFVYLGISAATFSHTWQAAGAFFEGNLATLDDNRKGFWLISGFLFAVAVDIGMLVSSQALKQYRHPAVLVVFGVSAVASLYTQFLYAIQHVEPIVFGEGVPVEWRGALAGVINLRIFIMPSLLPAIGFMLAVAKIKIYDLNEQQRVADLLARRLTVDSQASRYIPNNPAAPLKNPQQNGEKLIPATTEEGNKAERHFFRCSDCGFVGKNKDGKGYTDPIVRLRMAKKHITDNHKNLVKDEDKIALLKRFEFFSQEVSIDPEIQSNLPEAAEEAKQVEPPSVNMEPLVESVLPATNLGDTQEILVDPAISQ